MKLTVDVEGTPVVLSNLDKVLYPATGFSKGQVLDYYTRIAPVLLPHLAERALTRKRYPDGVDGQAFFEKNAPRTTPDWVRTVTLPTPGSSTGRETLDYVVVDDLATLVWTANLAALELHTHTWRIDRDSPDLVVFDLDPGPPATVVECCAVALLLRPLLAADGLAPLAKTSGSKGLHLLARADHFGSAEQTSAYAKELARRLEKEHPDAVLSRLTKSLRVGKVLVDWSQNSAAKTTVTAYSLRARERPTVSTPVTWKEIESCSQEGDLVFTSDDVLARVATHGDLLAPLL